jgi:hypothetical protein
VRTNEEMERYRKHPIYGTDFSKPVSVLIEDIRTELTRARGHITDIKFGAGWQDRLSHIEGLLTCGLIALYNSKEEIEKFEIAQDDAKYGKSLKFRPRGIGLDMCPGCFVCGTQYRDGDLAHTYLNNIAAFVASKEEGEQIVQWFDGKARLDFREREPDWIQVKVGACDDHKHTLEDLDKKTRTYGLIRECDVKEALGATNDRIS